MLRILKLIGRKLMLRVASFSIWLYLRHGTQMRFVDSQYSKEYSENERRVEDEN